MALPSPEWAHVDALGVEHVRAIQHSANVHTNLKYLATAARTQCRYGPKIPLDPPFWQKVVSSSPVVVGVTREIQPFNTLDVGWTFCTQELISLETQSWGVRICLDTASILIRGLNTASEPGGGVFSPCWHRCEIHQLQNRNGMASSRNLSISNITLGIDQLLEG